MEQNPSHASDLEDFPADLRPSLAELRQTDAKAAQRMIEDVMHIDDCGDPPFRQIAPQPERIGQILQTHLPVVVWQDGAEFQVGELRVEGVLNHGAELACLADDQWCVGLCDEPP